MIGICGVDSFGTFVCHISQEVRQLSRDVGAGIKPDGQQLGDKAQRAGGVVIAVEAVYTVRTCNGRVDFVRQVDNDQVRIDHDQGSGPSLVADSIRGGLCAVVPGALVLAVALPAQAVLTGGGGFRGGE